MKNKSSILILIVVFCICCSVTYLSLKGLPKKDDNKEKETSEVNNDNVEINRSAIEDAIKKLTVFEIWGKDFKPEDLSNDDLIFFIYENNDNFYEDGVSLEEARGFVNKYLGVELKKGSMKCPNGGDDEPKLIIFDESSNKFIINPDHPGHGGGGTTLNTINKIEKISSKDGIITVTVKKLFSSPFTDVSISTVYYNDFKSAINRKKDAAVFEDISEEFASDKEFDTGINRDKSKIDYSLASTYEYKFKIVDGNYVLVSYKEIK